MLLRSLSVLLAGIVVLTGVAAQGRCRSTRVNLPTAVSPTECAIACYNYTSSTTGPCIAWEFDNLDQDCHGHVFIRTSDSQGSSACGVPFQDVLIPNEADLAVPAETAAEPRLLSGEDGAWISSVEEAEEYPDGEGAYEVSEEDFYPYSAVSDHLENYPFEDCSHYNDYGSYIKAKLGNITYYEAMHSGEYLYYYYEEEVEVKYRGPTYVLCYGYLEDEPETVETIWYAGGMYESETDETEAPGADMSQAEPSSIALSRDEGLDEVLSDFGICHLTIKRLSLEKSPQACEKQCINCNASKT